jgi:hypothetical protein
MGESEEVEILKKEKKKRIILLRIAKKFKTYHGDHC